MVRADAVGLFGEDQVVRAWRYHRPLVCGCGSAARPWIPGPRSDRLRPTRRLALRAGAGMALVGAGRRVHGADRGLHDRSRPADLVLDGLRARAQLAVFLHRTSRFAADRAKSLVLGIVLSTIAFPRTGWIGAASASSLASGCGRCRGGDGAGPRLPRPAPRRASFQPLPSAR